MVPALRTSSRNVPRSNGRIRKRPSYREPDSEESSIDELEEPEQLQRRRPKKNKAPRSTPNVSGNSHRLKAQNNSRKRSRRTATTHPAGQPATITAKNEAGNGKPERKTAVPSDGVIPPWTTLPYDILLQTFIFAYRSLHEISPNQTVAWVLNAARTCRAFSEPALTAFYRNPTLLSPDKPHRFLELLSLPSGVKYMDYNAKVKRLDIDVRNCLAYSAPGKGLFDLATLPAHLPQLSEIHLTHPDDGPPFRLTTEGRVRWFYPDALFSSLQCSKLPPNSAIGLEPSELASTSEHHMKSWRWNAMFFGSQHKAAWGKQIHQSPSFHGLQYLSFTNCFNMWQGEDSTCEKALSETISSLPELKGLSLESTCLAADKSLSYLTHDLQHLSIINCQCTSTRGLQTYLQNHGSQLRELALDHNMHLDLTFLPELQTTCPQLQILHMDLTYYSQHENFDDSEPRSLIDSAENLPDLRHLVLKAELNIAWRDRAGFREQWIGRLRRVFLGVFPEPDPRLMSSKTFRLWKEKDTAEKSEDSAPSQLPLPIDSNGEALVASKRRSKRIAQHEDSDACLLLQDSDEPKRPCRGAGLRSRDEIPQTSDGNGEKRESRKASEPKFIQGLCQVVDIRIDNQRPREHQFNEGDFRDGEQGADDGEEWNEDDDDAADDGHAW
ncbi:hypothetical protein B0A49_06167 [Cryomyces minteri]|uniref:Uncharacterized protein n=1 Tax=Cryomyces minteri TaxID=331657 RepID=A0A4U0X5U7_9PEZI|nr:hypothetical protein B0A49_06167 [Cryomyces minteri]